MVSISFLHALNKYIESITLLLIMKHYWFLVMALMLDIFIILRVSLMLINEHMCLADLSVMYIT